MRGLQGSLLLHSHCVLYKSAMEEVRIWGWPLQTAGLLTTAFSSRSFTILSGRVTEVNAKLYILIIFIDSKNLFNLCCLPLIAKIVFESFASGNKKAKIKVRYKSK